MATLTEDVTELRRLQDCYLQLKQEESALGARMLRLRDATRDVEHVIATKLKRYNVRQLLQIGGLTYAVTEAPDRQLYLDPVTITVITEPT